MIYFALIIICTIKEASFNQLSCSCVYLPLCIWGVWLCNWFLRILSFLTLHLFLLLWLKILCFYFVVLFFKPPWFCIPYEGTGRWGEHPTAARAEGGEGAPQPQEPAPPPPLPPPQHRHLYERHSPRLDFRNIHKVPGDGICCLATARYMPRLFPGESQRCCNLAEISCFKAI